MTNLAPDQQTRRSNGAICHRAQGKPVPNQVIGQRGSAEPNLFEITFCSCFHYFPPSDCGSGKCNLVNVKMSGQSCSANVPQRRHCIQHAWWESDCIQSEGVGKKRWKSMLPCFLDELRQFLIQQIFMFVLHDTEIAKLVYVREQSKV
jgi:hypothetical protein